MIQDQETQARLKAMRSSGMSLTQIAEQLKVNKGLVHRALKGHHSPTIRHALNLPPLMVLARPCRVCGEVHLQKTCKYQRRNGQPVDRMNARLTIEEGQQARAMIEAMGYKTITEFWQDYILGTAEDCKRSVNPVDTSMRI